MSPPADLFAASSYAILKLYVHYQVGDDWDATDADATEYAEKKGEPIPVTWIDLRSSNLRWLRFAADTLDSYGENLWQSSLVGPDSCNG